MLIDSFVKLINDLRVNQITDDTDPNNIVLQKYTSPYDILSLSDSVRFFKPQGGYTWGTGTTHTEYDSNGNAWQAPDCGWMWGAGGKWA